MAFRLSPLRSFLSESFLKLKVLSIIKRLDDIGHDIDIRGSAKRLAALHSVLTHTDVRFSLGSLRLGSQLLLVGCRVTAVMDERFLRGIVTLRSCSVQRYLRFLNWTQFLIAI
jgi:hypothetical protein